MPQQSSSIKESERQWSKEGEQEDTSTLQIDQISPDIGMEAAEVRRALGQLVELDILSFLAEGPTGSRLARTVLRHADDAKGTLLEQIREDAACLAETRHGRCLLNDLSIYARDLA